MNPLAGKLSMSKSRPSPVAVLVLIALFAGPSIRAQSGNPSPADASAFEQQGRLAEAEQAWLTITRQNPNDAAAFASLGVVRSREQKYPEAAAAYRNGSNVKNLMSPTTPGRYEYMAKELREEARSNRQLAAAHEQMAKNATQASN